LISDFIGILPPLEMLTKQKITSFIFCEVKLHSYKLNNKKKACNFASPKQSVNSAMLTVASLYVSKIIIKKSFSSWTLETNLIIKPIFSVIIMMINKNK